MAYILLRRVLISNPDSTGLAYVATTDYWDTTARTYYHTQEPTATNNPFDLATTTEVQRVALGTSGGYKAFYYAGNGQVRTTRVAGTGAGGGGGSTTCTLTTPLIDPNPGETTAPGTSEAATDITAMLGAPPYHLVVSGPNSYTKSATAHDAIYPLRFYNLAEGGYTVAITDALGCQASGSFRITAGNGIPYGRVIQEDYYGDADSGTGTRLIWNTNTLAVESHTYQGGGQDGYHNERQKGDVLDGFFLTDGVTFRTVYADGNSSVYFSDVHTTQAATAAAKLELDNLILFNPDSSAEQNGGVLVEVNATALPITFSLAGHADNTTGSFDGLAAGSYTVTVTDAAGKTLAVPFSLKLRYGRRWQLAFSDPAGVACRLELWLRDYTGAVEAITGSGSNPVVLKSDGLSGSLGGQGDLPAVVGTACELSLLVLPGTLEQVVVNDDRACRCDVYYDDKLQFRGYVQPDIYHEPLLGGLLPVTLTATDGLAGLKDTSFLGHIGQRLQGRRPWLNTLLCALSRCGVAVPLRLFVNRRSTDMSDADAPELLATTERAGYWDSSKKEPLDDRTVVEGLAQALGGTLCQRAGQWQVRSPLEMLAEAPGRAYLPAGTGQPAVKASAPAGTLMPRSLERGWGWVTAAQQQQLRPGWKSLAGTTDAGWRKNAFPAGDAFSDANSWLEDGSQLRPIAGWQPGGTFPLVLVRAGDKGDAYATQLPRSATYNGAETARYLDSPTLPLVAAPEACPAYLTISGKLIPADYLQTGVYPAVAGTAKKAYLRYEVLVDGQPPAAPAVATFELAANLTAKDTVMTVPLPDMPAGTTAAVLRLYPWYADNADLLTTARRYDPNDSQGIDLGDVLKHDFGTGVYRLFQSKAIMAPHYFVAPTGQANDPYFQELPANNSSSGRLLLTSVAIELRPQQATWDAADNFRADGPAGTVRPTEALAVYHPDVPLAAGLFAGNRHAFSKAVALVDGTPTTAWARKIDKQPAPLFEANVYDALALRQGPSRLLTGVLKHDGLGPPYLLDSLDTPFDVPGRRFAVGATAWSLRLARSEVSLVEVGPGADIHDPLLDQPEGVRITHQAYPYALNRYSHYARRVHGGGVRVRH